MADRPERNSGVEEEPREKRGPTGFRSNRADRPSGTSDERSDAPVHPRSTQDPNAPAPGPGAADRR